MASDGHLTERREGDWWGLWFYLALCAFCAIPMLAFVGGCS